ncbi:hypothetical protein KR009_010010 [Drosophila setifemur]|nr:hypothetical protein KR009_010010 [Drosophila setifemur]
MAPRRHKTWREHLAANQSRSSPLSSNGARFTPKLPSEGASTKKKACVLAVKSSPGMDDQQEGEEGKDVGQPEVTNEELELEKRPSGGCCLCGNCSNCIPQSVYQYSYDQRCCNCSGQCTCHMPQQKYQDNPSQYCNFYCNEMSPIQRVQYGISYGLCSRSPSCARRITDLNTEEYCRNAHLLLSSKERSARSPSKASRSKSPTWVDKSKMDKKLRKKIKEEGVPIDEASLDQYQVQSPEKLLKVPLKKQDQSLASMRNKDTSKMGGEKTEKIMVRGKSIAKVTQGAPRVPEEDPTDENKARMYKDYLTLYKQENAKEQDTECQDEPDLCPTYTKMPEIREEHKPDDCQSILDGLKEEEPSEGDLSREDLCCCEVSGEVRDDYLVEECMRELQRAELRVEQPPPCPPECRDGSYSYAMERDRSRYYQKRSPGPGNKACYEDLTYTNPRVDQGSRSKNNPKAESGYRYPEDSGNYNSRNADSRNAPQRIINHPLHNDRYPDKAVSSTTICRSFVQDISSLNMVMRRESQEICKERVVVRGNLRNDMRSLPVEAVRSPQALSNPSTGSEYSLSPPGRSIQREARNTQTEALLRRESRTQTDPQSMREQACQCEESPPVRGGNQTDKKPVPKMNSQKNSSDYKSDLSSYENISDRSDHEAAAFRKTVTNKDSSKQPRKILRSRDDSSKETGRQPKKEIQEPVYRSLRQESYNESQRQPNQIETRAQNSQGASKGPSNEGKSLASPSFNRNHDQRRYDESSRQPNQKSWNEPSRQPAPTNNETYGQFRQGHDNEFTRHPNQGNRQINPGAPNKQMNQRPPNESHKLIKQEPLDDPPDYNRIRQEPFDDCYRDPFPTSSSPRSNEILRQPSPRSLSPGKKTTNNISRQTNQRGPNENNRQTSTPTSRSPSPVNNRTGQSAPIETSRQFNQESPQQINNYQRSAQGAPRDLYRQNSAPSSRSPSPVNNQMGKSVPIESSRQISQGYRNDVNNQMGQKAPNEPPRQISQGYPNESTRSGNSRINQRPPTEKSKQINQGYPGKNENSRQINQGYPGHSSATTSRSPSPNHYQINQRTPNESFKSLGPTSRSTSPERNYPVNHQPSLYSKQSVYDQRCEWQEIQSQAQYERDNRAAEYANCPDQMGYVNDYVGYEERNMPSYQQSRNPPQGQLKPMLRSMQSRIEPIEEEDENGVPVMETVCEKRTRTVTFEDELGDLNKKERIEERCRSRIDWERAAKFHLVDRGDVQYPEDDSTWRSSSSADQTCNESNFEDDYASCDEMRTQRNPKRSLPPFEACPCMYQTYLNLTAMCQPEDNARFIQ